MNSLLKRLPEATAATLWMRAFGLTQIPMLAFVGPTVVSLDASKVVIKIPLRRRTRNHLKTMYFGALAVGADLAAGFLAMRRIQESGAKIALIFKDLNAQFLKRAESDVYFTCQQGPEITALVEKAFTTGERVEMPIHVVATTPDTLGDTPVALFTLTLSLKRRN